MSDTATHAHDIPAPPAPGTEELIDEALTGLPAPPRARRRVLSVLLSGIAVASLFLAWQLKDDAFYALSPTTPAALGDGRNATPETIGLNRLVTLRAAPSMAGAVQYSRWLFPGEHVVFPVAGREGGAALYVQVSRDGAEALARGEFQGRLIRFGGAGGRYAGVGNFLRDRMGVGVGGDTWLVVDGATPRAMLWAPALMTLLLALALSDLALLARLTRPSRP
jgi:hypothetical protein